MTGSLMVGQERGNRRDAFEEHYIGGKIDRAGDHGGMGGIDREKAEGCDFQVSRKMAVVPPAMETREQVDPGVNGWDPAGSSA